MGHGDYRTKDQCACKFRKMNKIVTKFNGIFKNLLSQRKINESDNTISSQRLKFLRSTVVAPSGSLSIDYKDRCSLVDIDNLETKNKNL